MAQANPFRCALGDSVKRKDISCPATPPPAPRSPKAMSSVRSRCVVKQVETEALVDHLAFLNERLVAERAVHPSFVALRFVPLPADVRRTVGGFMESGQGGWAFYPHLLPAANDPVLPYDFGHFLRDSMAGDGFPVSDVPREEDRARLVIRERLLDAQLAILRAGVHDVGLRLVRLHASRDRLTR